MLEMKIGLGLPFKKRPIASKQEWNGIKNARTIRQIIRGA
jgi:hypothetical protein